MSNLTGNVLLLDPDNFTLLYDVKLSEALTRLGWPVVWITSTPQYGQMPRALSFRVERRFFKMLKSARWRSLLHHRCLLPIRRLLKIVGYFWGLYRLTCNLCRQVPGIVHVQWSLFPWVDRLLWKKWRQKGWVVIYTCHDPLPLSGSLPKRFSRITRRLCLASDAVIVHGQWARRTLEKAGIPADKIHVILPGSCSEPFKIDRHAARHLLGLDTDVPIILFFGFIKPYKGLKTLMDSLPQVRAELKRVQLVVAGEAMEPVSTYRKRLARKGLKDLVHWSDGYLSHEKSRLYFAAANVVVLPYVEASSSAVLLQAYSAGRPVVVSAVGDLPSMVEDQKTGLLVPPGDSMALSGAILRILKDEEGARQMGKNGREFLMSRFSWSEAASRTEALYLRLYDERSQ